MIQLTLEIDIKNHKEIAEKEGGKMAGIAASMSSGIEKKVEEAIKKEVKKALPYSLQDELDKKGVKASVYVF